MRIIWVGLILGLMVSTQTAWGKVLEGQVSKSGQGGVAEHSTEDLFPNPPSESQDAIPDEQTDRRHSLSISRFGTAVNKPGVVINIMQMSGNSGQLGAALSGGMGRRPMLQGDADQQLSCIGFMYDFESGTVLRVLPGSDLAGKIVPGDHFLSEDGRSPFECWQRGMNFGAAGSVTQLTFQGQNGVQTIICHRKPIAELMPNMASELNWSSFSQ